MKRIATVFVASMIVILLLVEPAQAITFGQPDGNRHPSVGAMIGQFPGGSLGLVCSGTLIAPTIFVTAAHCTAALASYGVAPDQVWVSFDEVVDEKATLLHGTYDLNPNFGHDNADLHDVAVVVLDVPVTHLPLARLPSAGLLEEMKQNGTLKSQRFVTVGYGAVRDDKTGGPQSLKDNNQRRYAEQSFQALKPTYIQFSMNPSTGDAGTCYGDSGGPHFIEGTSTIVAVTTTGDAVCRATDVDYRLDTASARNYLAKFVTLP